MKLQLMSDLHLSHWARAPDLSRNWFYEEFAKQTQTDAEVLVLAGDCFSLCPKDMDRTRNQMLSLATRYPRMLFVSGNHEFYGTGIATGLEVLAQLEREIPGLTVLAPDKVVVIGDHRFLGATMWYPKQSRKVPKISDHYAIEDLNPEAYAQYQWFKAFLEEELREGDVVVTHHAPSNKSLDPQWADSDINPWFIVPMDGLIQERKPKLWLHGHVHTPFDYVYSAQVPTRVIANPRGYPGEGVRFNPQLVIDLP